jgi:hypothetical protein
MVMKMAVMSRCQLAAAAHKKIWSKGFPWFAVTVQRMNELLLLVVVFSANSLF